MRALVTGGSSGVGRAVAMDLSRRGARVLATARRRERLAALASDSAEQPIDHEAGDLRDPAFRERLVATTVERLGGLDVVVAAAGGGAIGPFAETDARTFAEVLDLNLVAPAELVRACIPHLLHGHDPAIVFVGSILGLHPLPLHGDYCAAKSGLHALAGALRTELAVEGIAVTLAQLGPVETEFWDALVVGERPAWSRGRPVSATFAAAAILDGLERRRAVVTPGWRAKAYALMAGFLPGAIDHFAARHM
jgi:short-subunit dehydrogenase